MTDRDVSRPFRTAAIFGSSGAIGGAVSRALIGTGTRVYAGSRSGEGITGVAGDALHTPFAFDLRDEDGIAAAAKRMKDDPPDLILVATGVLTLPDGDGPERTYKRIDPSVMADNFALNVIGPALVAKHMLPIMPRGRRGVFAALSARVGSIGDNRLGGWHSYRASKAALNMLIRNFAIEMKRSHDQAIVVGLHPGTVDSALSRPFQTNLPDGQLTDPDEAGENLLRVIGALSISDSGKVFDWKGSAIIP